MSNFDIRNYFSKTANEDNKNIMIEKKTIDLKTDIKTIKPNTKKKTKNRHKIIDNITNSPIPKRKTQEINIQINFNQPSQLEKKIIENKSPLKKKNNIIDDDDEREIEEINLAEKNNYNLKTSEKKIYQIKEKKETLIPISVADFFSGKKIIQKEKKIEESYTKKEFKEDEENNKMEIDDDDKFENLNQNIMKEETISNLNFDNKNNNIDNNNNDNKNQIDETIKNIPQRIKNQYKNEQKNNLISIKKPNQETFQINSENIHNNQLIENQIKNNNNNYKTNINSQNQNNNNNNIQTNQNKTNNNLNNQNETNKNSNIEKPKSNFPSPQNLLWSDRHKPNKLSDIIGNQNQIKNISDWLDNWNNCILNGNKREINQINNFSNGKFSRPENINARALILSGPPGIGKTSTIRVLSKIKGYKNFELNASDNRNKDIINNSVGFLMNNTTLNGDSISNKNLIIMDEVDGMNGNEDKGGIKALIDIVKKTKVPIIFICNDIYCNKLKSLLNYCYDIRFNKPEKRQIVNRLYNICKEENIKIEHMTLDYIVESFNNDIRQSLNYLDLISRNDNLDFNYEKEKCDNFKKDKSVSITSFDVAKLLLTKSEIIKLNFNQRLDLFFIDFDLIPNLIFENFPNTIPKDNNKIYNLEKLCDITENISFSDVIEKRIKSNNEWILLPNKGIHSVIIPSTLSCSFCSYPKFPEFYSKISKMRKTKRQIKDLKNIFPFYSNYSIKNELSTLLFKIIIEILNEKGKDGIDEIINIFTNYKMTLMQFKDSLFDLQSDNTQKIYNKINPSIKTYFTKKLNEHFKSSIKITKSYNNTNENYVKRDFEGNIIEVDYDDIDEINDDDESSSSIFEPVKSRNKKNKKSKK